MTIFLIILAWALSLLLFLGFGIYAGTNSVEKHNVGVQGPPGPEGPRGPAGMTGLQGKTGPPGKCECQLEVSANSADITALQERMKRIERKAGFSV